MSDAESAEIAVMFGLQPDLPGAILMMVGTHGWASPQPTVAIQGDGIVIGQRDRAVRCRRRCGADPLAVAGAGRAAIHKQLLTAGADLKTEQTGMAVRIGSRSARPDIDKQGGGFAFDPLEAAMWCAGRRPAGRVGTHQGQVDIIAIARVAAVEQRQDAVAVTEEPQDRRRPVNGMLQLHRDRYLSGQQALPGAQEIAQCPVMLAWIAADMNAIGRKLVGQFALQDTQTNAVKGNLNSWDATSNYGFLDGHVETLMLSEVFVSKYEGGDEGTNRFDPEVSWQWAARMSASN